MTRGNKRLIWIAASFMLVSLVTRIGLAIYSGETFTLGQWTSFMAVGFIFDLVVLPCFLLPWALYDAVLPKFVTEHPALSTWETRWAAVWGAAYLAMFVVTSVSEFTFWTEFSSRFDFIAVDYLVYTHEVVRNIWQSYPIVLWLSLVFGFCFAATWFTWPRGETTTRPKWHTRWSRAIFVAILIALGIGAVEQDLAESDPNVFVQQLSTNGLFAFGHAFQNNELDYERYYPSLNTDVLNTKIRNLVAQPNAEFINADGINRTVRAHSPLRDLNVVMISIESYGTKYMGIFGNDENLSPEMDKLAAQGLLFTNLYATGTRTVRGLEALSVGTPPSPGQSIVRRPNNDNLKTLGGELKTAGWNPFWVYGGYGFFDNMNAYFGGNGYNVVDRTDIDTEGLPIHHETVWGVADEDLYSLALVNLDREYAQGNRFFAHIMTTSNHRPYTFPEDRIDMPQKKRESVVKYTDWAIGDFIRRSTDKPWFNNTLFVITSDHTAKAAGKTDLPPSRYHIPMFWYAPGIIEPGVEDRLMSQIDIAPTLLGWLGIDYKSRFFGYDLFNLEAGRERAFISTYQKLGYMKNDQLVVLDVKRDPVIGDALSAVAGGPAAPEDQGLVDEAIAWYQASSLYFSTGLLKDTD